MEKKEISFEERMGLDKAVEYLEAVIAELKAGRYVIEKEGDSLPFEPQGPVKLEVEVAHKKGSQELEIELSWKPEGEGEGEEDDDDEKKEPAMREEKEEKAAVPEIKTVEVPKAGRDKGGIVKVLSIAGLAAASAAVYSLLRWKKATRAKEATESAAEEKADAEKGEESAEAGEKAAGKGRKKVRELLKR
jgi:amphi-Trp domain-containing protein